MSTAKEIRSREDARAHYGELARRRYSLEVQAEEAMNALVGTLDEIRELDSEQRQSGKEAGIFDPKADIKPPLYATLSAWIGDRLGGRGGYAQIVRRHDSGKPLHELDRLSEPAEDQGAGK